MWRGTVHDCSLHATSKECTAAAQPSSRSSLTQFLLESVLLESRVSAQSVALACVAAATDLHPPVLPSLEPVAPFLGASDPKLRSRATKVSHSRKG